MTSNSLLLCLVSFTAFGTAGASEVCLLQEKLHITPNGGTPAAKRLVDAKKLQVDDLRTLQQGYSKTQTKKVADAEKLNDLQALQQGHNKTQSGRRHHSPGLQLLNAGVVYAASWKIGSQFPSLFMLPMIVGYILCGVICGPYVTNMLYWEVINTSATFSMCNVVSNTSLAFIGFCAGSELHFPTLGWDKFKIICRIIATVGFFVIVCGIPFVCFLVEPLMPIFSTEGMPCKIAAALTICVVEMAGSVIEVLAVYLETNAKGPMTELLLGTTMLTDMAVLTMFAIATNISIKACPLSDVNISMPATILSVFASITLWLIGGLLLAAVLHCYLMLPEFGLGIKPVLILGTAFALYESLMLLNDAIPDWSLNWGTINVDPLIVCMAAATIVNNFSSRRERFAAALHTLTPWLMPAFFTFVGATLDLKVIADNIVVVPLLFCFRFVTLAMGTRIATQQMALETNISQNLWMTIQSQSGVTLGLLTRLGQGQIGKQPWADIATAVITGGVVINQLVGPALCRYGIRSAGESHEGESKGEREGEVTKGPVEEEGDLQRTARKIARSTSFILREPN